MKEGLTKKTFQGFIWLSSTSGVHAIIQIGILAILARLITPEDFGVMQAVIVVVGLANLMSQMGVGPSIVQLKNLTNLHVRTAFTISLILGCFFGLVVFFSSECVAEFFSMPRLSFALKVVSIIFVIESFVVVSESMLQRKLQMKEYATVHLISFTVGYGFTSVLLAFLGFGLWALIVGIIIQVIIKAILIYLLQPISLIPVYSKNEFNELIYFGGGFTIGKISNYFASQGDNIITGRMFGAEILGFYSRAFALMVKPVGLIAGNIEKILFPAFSLRSGRIEKVSSGFVRVLSLTFFASCFISTLIFTLSESIVNLVLGDQWGDVVILLKFLSVVIIAKMSYKVNDAVIKSMGLVYQRAVIQTVYMVSVVLFAYQGALLGINEMVVGVVIANFGHYMMLLLYVKKVLDKSILEICKCHFSGLVWLVIFILINPFADPVIKSVNYNIFVIILTVMFYGTIFVVLNYILHWFKGGQNFITLYYLWQK